MFITLISADLMTSPAFWIAIVFAVLLLGVVLYYETLNEILNWKRFWGNRGKNNFDLGQPASDIARVVLDNNGATEVEVKKGYTWYSVNYWRTRRAIYMGRFLFERCTTSSIAYTMRACALAVLHTSGDEVYKKNRAKADWGIVSGILFLPLVALGVVLAAGAEDTGTIGLVCVILGMVVFGLSLWLSLSSYKIEIIALAKAKEMLEEMNVLSPDEMKKVDTVYKLEKQKALLSAIISVLYLIYYILKTLLKILAAFSKNKN